MLYAIYNIEAGGFKKGYHETESKEPGRLGLLQDAIATIDADVIALIDTYRWQDIFKPSDLRKIFGYEHVHTVPIDNPSRVDPANRNKGNDISTTVLSRRPFVHQGSLTLGLRDAAHVRVEDDETRKVDFVAQYGHPFCEARRTWGVEHFLEFRDRLWAPERGLGRVVLATDANSSEAPSRTVRGLGAACRLIGPALADVGFAAEENMISQVGECLRGDTVELLKSTMVDTAQEWQPTFPTRLGARRLPVVGRFLRPFARFDQIYHTPDMRTDQPLQVHRGTLFEEASDHYPVSAKILAD